MTAFLFDQMRIHSLKIVETTIAYSLFGFAQKIILFNSSVVDYTILCDRLAFSLL